MDDSIKNVKAIAALQSKYPDIRLKSLLAVEHLTYSEQKLMLENFYEDKFKSLLWFINCPNSIYVRKLWTTGYGPSVWNYYTR